MACSAPSNTNVGDLVPDTGGGADTGLSVDDTGGSGFDVEDDTTLGDDTGGGGGDGATGDGSVDGDSTCATSEVVAGKPPVYVIVIIDQSGSMSDDLARVKANINKLSDFLKATGLDYRVVMVARVGTGTFDMCVPPPLGAATTLCTDTTKPLRNSNPPIFRTSNQSVASTNALSLLLSSYDSATVGIGWQDALRTEAFKAIIPITDDNSALAATSFDTSLLAKAPAGMFGTATARKYAAFPIMGSSTYPS